MAGGGRRELNAESIVLGTEVSFQANLLCVASASCQGQENPHSGPPVGSLVTSWFLLGDSGAVLAKWSKKRCQQPAVGAAGPHWGTFWVGGGGRALVRSQGLQVYQYNVFYTLHL